MGDLLPFGQGVPPQGVEFHLRQDRPHTSTLVAPGQQGPSPWLNVADRYAVPMNYIQLAPPRSLSLRDCPTMAKMVPGHVHALHTTCLTTRWARTAVIAERVGGPLITTKVGQRVENAPSGREGMNIGARVSRPANALDKSNLSPQVRASHHTVLKPIAPFFSSVREPLTPISRPNTICMTCSNMPSTLF